MTNYKQIIKDFEKMTTPEKMEKLRKYDKLREYMAISLKEVAKDLQIDPGGLHRYMQARLYSKEQLKFKRINDNIRLAEIAGSIIRLGYNKISHFLNNVNSKQG